VISKPEARSTQEAVLCISTRVQRLHVRCSPLAWREEARGGGDIGG
jgi:hypothetical protein